MTSIKWKLSTHHNKCRFYFICDNKITYLTPREAQVLLLMKSKSYQEIADKLTLSKRTIESYAKTILEKTKLYKKSRISKSDDLHESLLNLRNLLKSYKYFKSSTINLDS